MRVYRVIHALAIVSLFVVAIMGIVSSMRQFPGAPLFGLAIWSLLLWKIWKRPQKWGLGVGIFLFFMIVFQTYLWRLAIANPKLDAQGASYSLGRFILYELPIFVAGICCILLRFRQPNEHKSRTT